MCCYELANVQKINRGCQSIWRGLLPFLVSERILAGDELDAQRRPLQLEGFAEGVLEIAAITVADLVDRIAMNDDDRRV